MKSQADLDVATWLQATPTEAEPGAYPRLLYNVNLPPVLARDAATEQAMGSSWRPVDLTPEAEAPLPDVPPVELTPATAVTPAAGGPYTFAVAITGSGTSGTWTATKDAVADWITITAPTTPQAAAGTVAYTVAVNATGAPRTANIYVNGKTFTVQQMAV